MIKVCINGANAGYIAAEWCGDNLACEDWDMWMENTWGTYLFEFKNEKDATLFSLKWAEYA